MESDEILAASPFENNYNQHEQQHNIAFGIGGNQMNTINGSNDNSK